MIKKEMTTVQAIPVGKHKGKIEIFVSGSKELDDYLTDLYKDMSRYDRVYLGGCMIYENRSNQVTNIQKSLDKEGLAETLARIANGHKFL